MTRRAVSERQRRRAAIRNVVLGGALGAPFVFAFVWALFIVMGGPAW